MDEPTKGCDCFTLQSVDTKPIVIVHGYDPVATIGLISVFLLIVAMLVLAIYLRRGPATGRRHWW
jgi:hypothetical protein